MTMPIVAVRNGLRIAAALSIVALSTNSVAATEDDERTARVAEFDAFCRFVADDYAYFDVKKTDWAAVCVDGRRKARDAEGRDAFIGVVEQALAELYDFHAHLGTSNAASWRLVPTDSDLFAAWQGGAAMIVDVRRSSAAEAAGLRAGMRVVEIDGQEVGAAIRATEPSHLVAADAAARDWALRVVLAGHQDRQPVRVTVAADGARRTFAFVPGVQRPAATLSVQRVGRVGVITLNNSLGDQHATAAFDAALASLDDVAALVLDLRDTASGGTSSVARGIMGRLVAREAPYQRHERISEARENGVRHVWVEYVEPRGRPFTRPVVVLVGRWTGSMGEGIAIGLHAARGAVIVGRPMAGLLGALDEIELPHARFVVRIPAEKLFAVDGTPRERFVPRTLRPRRSRSDGDDDLASAIEVANGLLR